MQGRAAVLKAHLALAELGHGGCHFLKTVIFLGIDDFRAADIERGFLCRLINLVFLADENGLQECTGQQAGAGLKNTGVCALGKHNGLRILLQTCDQLLEHGCSFLS